jgi:hypothetical protein
MENELYLMITFISLLESMRETPLILWNSSVSYTKVRHAQVRRRPSSPIKR